MNFNIFSDTIIRFKHHRTTIDSFGKESEKRISFSSSLKQLADILIKEWDNIPLETIQKL